MVKRSWLKLILLTAVLAAAVVAARSAGFESMTQVESLRRAVAGKGALGPVLYILIYAVAPLLFLPGLPMTVAAGILFGPVWGTVFAITGATIGASLAFLVARYGARDWVASRLGSERWRELDDRVARQGWKIVAFTRLVPLFPFNLLNYAFGITGIPFLPYVITSFFCMLPACAAYVVFSSSIPELLSGVLSPQLVAGGALLLLLMLAAGWLRRRN